MGQVTDFFEGCDSSSDIKADGDFLGGFSPFESDMYDFTVTMAYLNVAASGAKCMSVTFKTAEGKEFKQDFYYTSGKAKGGKNFYTNTKTGEKHFLPGFTMAQHLACLTAGKTTLSQLTIEERHIKLYSKEAKAEVATPVNMCVEMLDKPVSIGVIKRLVDKQKDSGSVDAQGKKIYICTGESKIENEAIKAFRTRDKMTVTEILAKSTEAVFAAKWVQKYKGTTEDRTTKTNGTAGAPKMTPTGNPVAGPDLGTLFA